MAGNVHQDNDAKLKARVKLMDSSGNVIDAGALEDILTELTAIKDTDGIKKIADAVTVIQDTYANLLAQVKVTDGTNFMPTMDGTSRPGYQRIQDGTGTAKLSTVQAGQTGAENKIGILALGRRASDNKCLDLPIAGSDDTAAEKGEYIIPVTPITGDLEEGIKSIIDNVNIGDLSAGTQTNDVKITLDGETIGVGYLATTLTALNQTYYDDPTTDVSAAVTCHQYRQATLAYELDKANTPTDILFEVEVSLDGTNYTKLMNDFLGDLRYDDTAVGAGIEESVTFPIACQKIRVRVTCTGTDATNTFTVANCVIYLRN